MTLVKSAVVQHKQLTLHQKATIHQVTTMLATFKNDLFISHNHLQTISTNDTDTLIIA